MRKISVVVTSLMIGAAFTSAAGAGVTPEPVKTSTANELSPAATDTWFAWTQSPADQPNRANVRAEQLPIDGVDDFKVNADGTRAWTGGIEGNQLVYQEIDSGDSDIRLHDLSTNDPLADEPINSLLWEWHPSISTDSNGDTWIMFGRQNPSTGVQRVFAWNATDDVLVLLQEITRRRHSLIPGQVNGNWVTWTACRPDCHVRYDDLLDVSAPVTVPRPSFVAHQYASSISDDGTLYFVRSGRGCGANVRLMRRVGGDNQLLVDYPDRRDTFFTYTSDDVATNEVYYDRVACGSGAWNIYKVTD